MHDTHPVGVYRIHQFQLLSLPTRDAHRLIVKIVPIDADFEAEGAAADRNVAIRQHYDALNLEWHDLLVDHAALYAIEVVVFVVDLAVVLQDDQRQVAAPLALRHARFQSPFYAADKRVDLLMILFLHQSHRIGEDGFQYRFQTALADLTVKQDFNGVRLHALR